jgi:pyridoxal phosphate enzyme (YggS family)
MSDLCARIREVTNRIGQAAVGCGRDPSSITLLAVSKGQPAKRILEAVSCGQRRFGENYLQEALPKMELLRNEPIEWHFIGSIQSNKTRPIAQNFGWVHTVDRAKVARRLNDQRPEDQTPLQVCLEVNVSREGTKSGVDLKALPALAELVQELPRLRLRGLMAIPALSSEAAGQRSAFAKLREAFQALVAEGYPLDTLSMGMSADLEAAIAEGATVVRVGTAIFGPRV